jgi:hypothetical protein
LSIDKGLSHERKSGAEFFPYRGFPSMHRGAQGAGAFPCGHIEKEHRYFDAQRLAGAKQVAGFLESHPGEDGYGIQRRLVRV